MKKVTFCSLLLIFLISSSHSFAQTLQDQSGATGRQIGATVGSMAGGATGNFISKGNIAATTAGSEVGRQVGGIAGEQAFRAISEQSKTSTKEPDTSFSENEGAQIPSLPEGGLGETGKETPSLFD